MNRLICAMTMLAVSTGQADTIYVDDDCSGSGTWALADWVNDFVGETVPGGSGEWSVELVPGTCPE